MCWDMTFPEDWLCSMTVMAPKVVGATCLTKFRPIAGLCAMRKVLGYVRFMSLPPLKYESVQTAFVPKTHADAGLFLLLQAAELSREWQKEIVVVQMDVKKAFDHVDHRAAFKAMKLQGVSLFSMALIAAIWNGSCMKARLGTVSSNKIRMSRGLRQRAPESPVIFTMIIELVLRDLIKSWITRKLAWRLDDFALAAICYADDVVLIAVSKSAAEIMVTEVIAKLKEVGLSVGAQKTHCEDDGQKHGGWTGCVVGGSSGVCGVKGVLGRERKTCDRSQICSSQQMYGEVEISSEFLIAAQVVEVESCTNYNVASLSLEFECLDDGQGPERQNCELECEDGGTRHWCEKTAMDGIGLVVETLAQNWTSLDREGQHERSDCHQRACAQLGRSCGQVGPQGNLCEGFEMPWSSMVEMETAPLERSEERQVVWPTSTAVQNLQGGRTWWRQRFLQFTGNADGLSESVQENTGWLHLAQNRGSWKQFSKCGKSPVWVVPGVRGPIRVRHDWDECWCYLFVKGKITGYGWLDS